MPKKSKFKVKQIVSVDGNEGELMETVDNGDGTFQHRVRMDMADIWVPEKKLELVRDVEEETQRKADDVQKSRKSDDQKHDEEIAALVSRLEDVELLNIELETAAEKSSERLELNSAEITELLETITDLETALKLSDDRLKIAEDRVAELNDGDLKTPTPPVPVK